MILIFFYSSKKEKDIIENIFSKCSSDYTYEKYDVMNYDPNKVIQDSCHQRKSIITFGKIAGRAVTNLTDIDEIMTLPTATEISKKYTVEEKKKLIQDINDLYRRDEELSRYTNLDSIDLSILEGIDKDKIVAAIVNKQMEIRDKYIIHTGDKIIEISDKKEIKDSIHMTLEDLTTLFVIKNIFGATIKEIRKEKTDE